MAIKNITVRIKGINENFGELNNTKDQLRDEMKNTHEQYRDLIKVKNKKLKSMVLKTAQDNSKDLSEKLGQMTEKYDKEKLKSDQLENICTKLRSTIEQYKTKQV